MVESGRADVERRLAEALAELQGHRSALRQLKERLRDEMRATEDLRGEASFYRGRAASALSARDEEAAETRRVGEELARALRANASLRRDARDARRALETADATRLSRSGASTSRSAKRPHHDGRRERHREASGVHEGDAGGDGDLAAAAASIVDAARRLQTRAESADAARRRADARLARAVEEKLRALVRLSEEETRRRAAESALEDLRRRPQQPPAARSPWRFASPGRLRRIVGREATPPKPDAAADPQSETTPLEQTTRDDDHHHHHHAEDDDRDDSDAPRTPAPIDARARRNTAREEGNDDDDA